MNIERAQAYGEQAVHRLIEFGIGGGGPLKGAVEVAEEHLRAADEDREQAVRRSISTHVRLAAGSGFLTGLGGIATLPVMVPASLAGLYVIATRMSAGVAHLRGYDVDTEEVRSAVLISLLGAAGATTLKKAGVEIGRKTTMAAVQKVPGRVLIEVNKKIGFRLVTKAGEKGVVNLTKLVPLVGGPVGAAIDGVSCRTIATYALATFEQQC